MQTENKKQKTAYQRNSFNRIVKRNVSGWVLILPSVFLFVMLVWRPILIGISYSFFKLVGFTPTEFVGLKNYADVLSDTNFITVLKNTYQYVLWSLVIGFPLPIICAVMVNEMVHMQKFFKISIYLPVIIPGIATCMIWRMLYMDSSTGLLNTIRLFMGFEPCTWLSNKNIVIPLIVTSMTWNGFGSTLIIYLAAIQGINPELYDVARLDGAGFFRRIYYVLIPHTKGLILLMVIRQIIGIFNVTEQPLIMTDGGPNGASVSMGLLNYNYAFKFGQYDKSLAVGVITFCLLIVLTFIYFGLDKRTEG